MFNSFFKPTMLYKNSKLDLKKNINHDLHVFRTFEI